MPRLLISSIACLLSFSAAAEDAKQLVAACNNALKSGDFAQAATQANKALEAFGNNRDAYLCLGRAKSGRGEHAAAVAVFQAADKFSVTPTEHIVALTLLGNQHKSARAHTEALAAYRASLAIARAAKEEHFERINLNQVGESLEGTGNLPDALEHYLQGQKLAANDNERADSSGRIASVYSLLGEHDKAIEHQLQTMLLEERSGDLDHYANAGIELGRVYTAAKEFANAEKALNKILGTITQAGDSYWEAKACYMFGRLRIAQGRATDAADFFARGKALADKIGAEELARDIADAQAAATK